MRHQSRHPLRGEQMVGALGAYPNDVCLHELFEAQVALTPDSVAVVCEDEHLTYAQLNARANQLAHYLRGLGVRPESRVGLLVERSLEMVVGMLAVLKAGGAYVPLDPSYPMDRLNYLLKDSAPAALLSQTSLKDLCDEIELPLIDLTLPAPPWGAGPETNPDRTSVGVTPGHLAYVVYTSGSIGHPKGVMVAHRGVVNLVHAQVTEFAVGPGSRVLQFASPSFDASVSEVFVTLACGGQLHLLGDHTAHAGSALRRVLSAARITHVTLPPSVAATLPSNGADDLSSAENVETLQTLVVAGESCLPVVAARWATVLRRFINAYGPSETTVCATLARCGEVHDSQRVPIGRPIANVRVYVLDANCEPVPAGVTGELYVGGAGVARGYLNKPGMTADRFVPDPFGKKPGERLYRTGDRARWRTDGQLEFMGRIDLQVKLRGYRIELEEIEGALVEHPAVREAVVMAREDSPGVRRLVAYYTQAEGSYRDVVTVDALREHLTKWLPTYMVPAAYVRLDSLPRTPNGKINRKMLPEDATETYATSDYFAPRTATERALCEIWRHVLGLERVGIHDNFFDLGGHSLNVLQVAAALSSWMEQDIDPIELFYHQTVATLSHHLMTGPSARHPLQTASDD